MNKITRILQDSDRLKEEINSLRPFDHHEKMQMKEYYRIGLTYSSNALEGNSLTESETKVVLEEGITIGDKPLRDHLEAVGHSDAYDFMWESLKEKNISHAMIVYLHHLFYHRINEKKAGVYRHEKVYLTGSKYPLPLPQAIPELMSTWIEKLNESRRSLHPVIFAAEAHKDFVFIHPFIDGNGRVARLLMNLILLQDGYTIALIPPVLRKDYITSLEQAHEHDEEFVYFIASTIKEGQKDFLRLFR